MKSVYELDESVRQQQATSSGYAMAIRALAQYALELDPGQAEQFRQHLGALQVALETASQPENFQAIQASFRGELRDYRDKGQEWVARMRSEMQATAEALQSLANGMASNGTGYEQQLNADLQILRTAAESQDLAKIRATIKSAVASMAQSLDEMLSANRLTMAQLNDEIRLLHREMANERRILHTDRVSGAWNRERMAGRIEELLERRDAFCVVVAWLSNFKRVENRSSRPVLEGALKALVKRAHGIMGADAMFGRWDEDEFVVIVEAVAGIAIAVSTELSQELSLCYAVQHEGISHQVAFRITTVVVERPEGGNPDQFRQRLKQSSVVLRGAAPKGLL